MLIIRSNNRSDDATGEHSEHNHGDGELRQAGAFGDCVQCRVQRFAERRDVVFGHQRVHAESIDVAAHQLGRVDRRANVDHLLVDALPRGVARAVVARKRVEMRHAQQIVLDVVAQLVQTQIDLWIERRLANRSAGGVDDNKRREHAARRLWRNAGQLGRVGEMELHFDRYWRAERHVGERVGMKAESSHQPPVRHTWLRVASTPERGGVAVLVDVDRQRLIVIVELEQLLETILDAVAVAVANLAAALTRRQLARIVGTQIDDGRARLTGHQRRAVAAARLVARHALPTGGALTHARAARAMPATLAAAIDTDATAARQRLTSRRAVANAVVDVRQIGAVRLAPSTRLRHRFAFEPTRFAGTYRTLDTRVRLEIARRRRTTRRRALTLGIRQTFAYKRAAATHVGQTILANRTRIAIVALYAV
jgi:hypothetical protein